MATALLLAATAISGYARSQLVDSQAFANRAETVLDDPYVRELVADKVVSGLAQNVAPDALVVRPLVVSAVAKLAGSQPFRRLFARAIKRRHQAAFGQDVPVAVRLLAGGGELLEALRSVSPRLASAIPRGLTVPLVALNPRGFELTTAHWATRLAGWWWPLLAASLVAALACALVAGSLRAAIAHVAVAVAGGGALLAAVVAGFGAWATSRVTHAIGLDHASEVHAVQSIWTAFFGDLKAAGLLAAAGGALVALLASGALTRERVAATSGWLNRAARSPRPAATRARAAVLIAVGVALLLAPTTAVRVLAIVAGGLLLLAGAAQLTSRVALADAPTAASRGAPMIALAGAIVVITAVTVVALALVLPGPSAIPAAEPSTSTCNGSDALCDKRLDEVAFPATHNSYAAADEPGWYFPNQRHGIARQLRDGIRAFLIDIHYGVPDPRSGRVRTDLKYEGSSRNKVARELSPQALRVADRLVGGVGFGPIAGRRRPYLCHTLCELGAEPLDQQFEIIRRYLDAHPRVVLILFVEPYVPAATVQKALTETELLPYAAHIRRDAALPTLGELIRANRRLLILAEEDGGTRPWYLDGFSFVQDNPLGARRPGGFSCDRYRGNPDSPLLLLNHWITTFPPRPRPNQRAGGSALLGQVRRCERRRKMLPNLLAVDFYERTGVVGIAERLNRRR